MTMQTARNPLADVPPTQLLRTFQQIAKDYTRKISEIYYIPFADVTLKHLEVLETLSFNLDALSRVFREVGNRLNPFPTLGTDRSDNNPLEWISFNDYLQTYDFYLNIALPQSPLEDLYMRLCHDVIDQTYRLRGKSIFLMVLAKQNKLTQKIHQEITYLVNMNLWKIEAMIDAAANYEEQQFGEQ